MRIKITMKFLFLIVLLIGFLRQVPYSLVSLKKIHKHIIFLHCTQIQNDHFGMVHLLLITSGEGINSLIWTVKRLLFLFCF